MTVLAMILVVVWTAGTYYWQGRTDTNVRPIFYSGLAVILSAHVLWII